MFHREYRSNFGHNRYLPGMDRYHLFPRWEYLSSEAIDERCAIEEIYCRMFHHSEPNKYSENAYFHVYHEYSFQSHSLFVDDRSTIFCGASIFDRYDGRRTQVLKRFGPASVSKTAVIGCMSCCCESIVTCTL